MQRRAADLQFFLFGQLDVSVDTNQHQLLRVMRQLLRRVRQQMLQLVQSFHPFRDRRKQQCLLQLILVAHPLLVVVKK
jgi:hypothetical protein